MSTATKDGRLSVRVHADVKESIEKAARVAGLSTSDFIISASAKAATEILKDQSVLQLSEDEFARFCEALEGEVAPNEAALAAARRFNETTTEGNGVRCSTSD